MRHFPVIALCCLALSASAQEVREESRLDQSLEGAHFVMHWGDADDVALGDAGRVLAMLERARLHAEEEGYPAIPGTDTFLLDIIVDADVDLIGLEQHADGMPFLMVSPALFTEPQAERDGLLAQAYAAAILTSVAPLERCAMGTFHANAIIMNFARPLSPESLAIAEIARTHLEDGGRFGGEGNLFLFLAWAEDRFDAPLVGPALSACSEQGFAFALEAELLTASGDDTVGAWASFFVDLFLDRDALPNDLAAVIEPGVEPEPVFPFDGRFEELAPGGLSAYELLEPGAVAFNVFNAFELDPDLRVMLIRIDAGEIQASVVEPGEILEDAGRRMLVFFNASDTRDAFIEWNLGDELFFEGECFDECECFGGCDDFFVDDPGPCAGTGLPKTTPWGLLGLLLLARGLATGTARAGARRRRGSGSGAAARRAPRG